ncbi:MAG: hypothetical protein MI867_12540 [Pseudomonadales bacterium]|nr:hypothetical protein [Pseudomonadales bacterium]
MLKLIFGYYVLVTSTFPDGREEQTLFPAEDYQTCIEAARYGRENPVKGDYSVTRFNCIQIVPVKELPKVIQ